MHGTGLTPDEVRVVRVSLAGDAGAGGELLSPDERARADRFRRPELRRRYAIAHAALRVELSRAVGCAPGELVFAEGEHGKPSLVVPECDVQFNLSHSGEHAVIALTRERAVGVDVEHLRPVRATAIARRFFAPSEFAALERLQGADRDRAFLRCWTRKEAWVKGLGQGLRVSLSSFEVGVEPGSVRLVRGTEEWTLRDLSPDPRTVACVAAQGAGWRLVESQPDA